MSAKWALALLVGPVLLFGSSTRATSVRSGSGYGQDIGFSACQTNVQNFDPTDPQNCIGAQPASFTEEIGGTDYPVFQFAFVGFQSEVGQVTAAVYDLVDLGPVTAGESFQLPVLNTGLLTGVFACQGASNGTATTVVDSTGTTVHTVFGGNTPLPCTPFDSTAFITQTSGVGEVQFDVASGISDLTLLTLDGNLTGGTPVPEPASIFLAGMGISAFLALRRRKAD